MRLHSSPLDLGQDLVLFFCPHAVILVRRWRTGSRWLITAQSVARKSWRPKGAGVAEPSPAVVASWGSAPGITQSEILDWLQRGGYIRSIIVETEPSDTHKTRYSVFLLTSWRAGYHIMHVNWPARPRLFKDFERLQALLRHDFRYVDTIAVRLPNAGTKKRRSHFRER